MPSVRLSVCACPGLQRDLGEGLQLLRRADERSGFVVHVELHHLAAGALAGVAHRQRDGQRLAGQQRVAVERQALVHEGAVRQPMAEGEPRLDAMCLMVAIADRQALTIGHMAVDARVLTSVAKGHGVLDTQRPGLRQPAAWIGSAEQHVGDRVAAFLARVPGL